MSLQDRVIEKIMVLLEGKYWVVQEDGRDVIMMDSNVGRIRLVHYISTTKVMFADTKMFEMYGGSDLHQAVVEIILENNRKKNANDKAKKETAMKLFLGDK